MLERKLRGSLLEAAKYSPVIAITGPRQSGKTTLAKSIFNKHKYISFEDVIGIQERIKNDPKGFLEEYENDHGIIFDEFQNFLSIMPYIQMAVNEKYRPGYFILIGSQNFLVNHEARRSLERRLGEINQTLSWHIAIFTLLPLAINELKHANLVPERVELMMYKGLYPGIYDQNLSVSNWYPNYIRTYLEPDIRKIKNISDLNLFKKFMQLCAGRIGQPLNITSLANDCGISPITVNSWISLLEASYVIFLLKPYFKNFNKRLIKSPKLYFYDTGLACSLLGIDFVEQLHGHYLRGGLFESMVISEVLKEYYNAGKLPRVYYWRDKTGHEIDCLVDGARLIPIEIKSGKTASLNFFEGLDYWTKLTQSNQNENIVVYAGDEDQIKSRGRILRWKSLNKIWTPNEL